tara:strand:- start:107 stop:538 length:432 start_codon:yes stop_codon:yes gene_type:complete
MNKLTSILVAFAFAFFVAFALTANEILSNDNLKTEITTLDKSPETSSSSKTKKSCCSKDNNDKEVSGFNFSKKNDYTPNKKIDCDIKKSDCCSTTASKESCCSSKTTNNDQVKVPCSNSKIASNAQNKESCCSSKNKEKKSKK